MIRRDFLKIMGAVAAIPLLPNISEATSSEEPPLRGLITIYPRSNKFNTNGLTNQDTTVVFVPDKWFSNFKIVSLPVFKHNYKAYTVVTRRINTMITPDPNGEVTYKLINLLINHLNKEALGTNQAVYSVSLLPIYTEGTNISLYSVFTRTADLLT